MESYHLAWLLCFLMILMTIVSLYIYCLKRGCCDDCPCHQQGTDDIDFAKYPLKATHYTATSPNNNFSLATNGRVSNGHFNPPSVATASVGTKTAPDLEHQQLNDSTNKLQKKHDPFVEAYLNYYSTISNVYRDHELDDAAATLNQHRNSHHLRAKSLTLTDPPKRKRYRNGEYRNHKLFLCFESFIERVVDIEPNLVFPHKFTGHFNFTSAFIVFRTFFLRLLLANCTIPSNCTSSNFKIFQHQITAAVFQNASQKSIIFFQNAFFFQNVGF